MVRSVDEKREYEDQCSIPEAHAALVTYEHAGSNNTTQLNHFQVYSHMKIIYIDFNISLYLLCVSILCCRHLTLLLYISRVRVLVEVHNLCLGVRIAIADHMYYVIIDKTKNLKYSTLVCNFISCTCVKSVYK